MFDFFVDLAISFWVIAATRVRSIISLYVYRIPMQEMVRLFILMASIAVCMKVKG